MILWTNKTKTFRRLETSYIWHKTNTGFHKKNIIPTGHIGTHSLTEPKQKQDLILRQ